ncbi:hypothetical protein [Aquimarina aggregata]|nr:hypothetical protein [Aquimarina aggregata]
MDIKVIKEGIIIAGTGGIIAAIFIPIFTGIKNYIFMRIDRKKVESWLDEHTAEDGVKKGAAWRSTRAIASHNNLTEDRVRYICSNSKKIILSISEEELWGYKGKVRND